MKILLVVVILLITTIFVFNSCKDDESSPSKSEGEQFCERCLSTYTAYKNVDECLADINNSKTKYPNCATVYDTYINCLNSNNLCAPVLGSTCWQESLDRLNCMTSGTSK